MGFAFSFCGLRLFSCESSIGFRVCPSALTVVAPFGAVLLRSSSPINRTYLTLMFISCVCVLRRGASGLALHLRRDPFFCQYGLVLLAPFCTNESIYMIFHLVFHMFIHSCLLSSFFSSNCDTLYVPLNCMPMGDGRKFQHACFLCLFMLACFCFDAHACYHVD